MLRIKVNYRRNDTSKRLVTLNWKKKGNGLKCILCMAVHRIGNLFEHNWWNLFLWTV